MNFFKTGAGVVFSQLLSIMLLPIIARMYSPEEFGTYGYFLGVFALLAPIASFRLCDAIVVAKSDNSAAALSQISIFICMILLSIIYVVSVFFDFDSELIYSLCISIFAFTLIQRSLFWFVRKSCFATYSIVNALVTGLIPIFQIILYNVSFFNNLVEIHVFSYIVAAVICEILFRKNIIVPKGISRRVIVYSIKKHIGFIKFLTPYSVLGSLRQKIPYFILGAGSSTAGFLTQAERIMNAPNSMLSGAIRPVLYGYYSREGINNTNIQLVDMIVRGIASLTFPIFVFIAFNAKELIGIVLGDKWLGADNVFLFILISSAFILLSNWMDRLLDVANRQKLGLKLECVFSLTIISIMLLSVKFELAGDNLILIFSILLTVGTFGWLVAIYKVLNIGLIRLMITLCYIFLISGVFFLINFTFIGSDGYYIVSIIFYILFLSICWNHYRPAIEQLSRI